MPADAVAFIIGKGGANIRETGETSGCRVTISKEGETPSTLADKIISFGGLVEQKEQACGMVLRKLRQMQGVSDHEPGVFVIIVPQVCAPVIIGSKGAQIKAIMEQSGAEINVGREAIIGMPDQPISVNGTLNQVVSAVSQMNSVLQDMADRGKLMDKDFVYKSHEAAAPVVDHGRGGLDGPASTPAPSANSDWDRPPAGCSASGRSGASDWDQAPAAGPAGPTTTPAANGAFSGDGYPSTTGNSLGTAGTSFSAGPPSSQPSSQNQAGHQTSQGNSCSASFSPAGTHAQQSQPTSFGQGGCGATSFGPSGNTGMSFGAGPPSSQPSSQNQTNHQASQGSSCTASFSPSGQSSQQNQQTSFGGQGGTGATSFGPSGQTGPSSFGPGGSSNSFGSQAPSSFGPNGGNSGNSFGPNNSSFGSGMGPAGNMGAGMNSMGGGMGMGGMGSMGGMGGMGSMGGLGMGMGGLGGMGMNNPMAMGGMGMGMGMNGMGMGNPMLGGMGMGNPMLSGIGNSPNERAFLNALQSSGINNAQLTLLIPQALVQNILIPRGIMAEIAQRSGSQIDLGVESPPGMRQVTVSGTMVSNALASLFLQEKVIQFQQMS